MSKYTTEELFELIESDGMAAAIRQVSHKKIADPDLAEIWERAKEILRDIDEFFEDHRSFDDDEDEDNENDDEL